MKLVFITVLAIASLGTVPEAIALLPDYAIAQTTRPDAIARFSRNSAPGGTQPSSRATAQQPSSPDTGTPNGQRTPGGSRGGACKKTERPFTALVPENGKGLTTAEHPVFWFYIPDDPKDIQAIEFSLHDQNETTTLYRTSLQLTKTPGVIGIPLPSNPENSLKFNESYHWRFIVHCAHKETPEEDPELEGWVRRVQYSPNLWYDELTTLAKRYLSNPQNAEVQNAWTQLLKSVGLEELAKEPLIQPGSNSEK